MSGDRRKTIKELFPKGIKHYLETDLLDQAIQVGMTPDEYWYGDPSLLENYEVAYRKRREEAAYDAWLSGVYVKAAISSSVFACGIFDSKKASSMPVYPDFKFSSLEKTALSDDEIDAERKRAALFCESLLKNGGKGGKSK